MTEPKLNVLFMIKDKDVIVKVGTIYNITNSDFIKRIEGIKKHGEDIIATSFKDKDEEGKGVYLDCDTLSTTSLKGKTNE